MMRAEKITILASRLVKREKHARGLHTNKEAFFSISEERSLLVSFCG